MENIPEGVIERLPAYLKCLIQLKSEGFNTASSATIGRMTGINSAEIRRDLIHFGSFGTKGVGYEIRPLIDEIRAILGFGATHKIALVGVGNLGSAIINHEGLKRHGFRVSAIFDNDPAKIGKPFADIVIKDIRDLPHIVKESGIIFAILAVPPGAAQPVADLLVDAGIRIVLNYTSRIINLPRNVQVHNSDPVDDLLNTLHHLSAKNHTLDE